MSEDKKERKKSKIHWSIVNLKENHGDTNKKKLKWVLEGVEETNRTKARANKIGLRNAQGQEATNQRTNGKGPSQTMKDRL